MFIISSKEIFINVDISAIDFILYSIIAYAELLEFFIFHSYRTIYKYRSLALRIYINHMDDLFKSEYLIKSQHFNEKI